MYILLKLKITFALRRMFEYLGNNELAPFEIIYKYETEPLTITNLDGQVVNIVPLNLDTIPCNTEVYFIYSITKNISTVIKILTSLDEKKERKIILLLCII